MRRSRIEKKRQPRYGFAACAQHYIDSVILRDLVAAMADDFLEDGAHATTVHPRESGGILNREVGKFTA